MLVYLEDKDLVPFLTGIYHSLKVGGTVCFSENVIEKEFYVDESMCQFVR